MNRSTAVWNIQGASVADRGEDNLEHDAQAELAKRTAQTRLGDMRGYIPKGRARACRELQGMLQVVSQRPGGGPQSQLQRSLLSWRRTFSFFSSCRNSAATLPQLVFPTLFPGWPLQPCTSTRFTGNRFLAVSKLATGQPGLAAHKLV